MKRDGSIFVFIHAGLSESDRLICLSHELAHVELHKAINSVIGKTKVAEENEANEVSFFLRNPHKIDKSRYSMARRTLKHLLTSVYVIIGCVGFANLAAQLIKPAHVPASVSVDIDAGTNSSTDISTDSDASSATDSTAASDDEHSDAIQLEIDFHETVYIVNGTGAQKYHKNKDCLHIRKKSVSGKPAIRAILEGYGRCLTCYPVAE